MEGFDDVFRIGTLLGCPPKNGERRDRYVHRVVAKLITDLESELGVVLPLERKTRLLRDVFKTMGIKISAREITKLAAQ